MGLKIAIAGAGIGGLAAAALLAPKGHEVTVYDQFEAPRPVGSGLILQETGLTILGEMGLRRQAEALGTPIRRLHGVSAASGRTVLDVRYRAVRSSLHGLAIQRSALFGIVHEAARMAGAQIVPGTRIIVASSSTGHLTTGEGRTLGPFDAVVDAMGVRSPLSSRARKRLAYGALWATLDWPDGSGFDRDALEQRYRLARQMAGVMPSGRLEPDGRETLTYFWSIRAEDHAAWRQAPIDAWKQAARALWPETEPLLDQITSHDQLTFARYDHRTHPSAVHERLVHVGDSWHSTSPQLGQGANMALLDAYALAKAFSVHDEIDRQLQHYELLRRGHVRLFQAMSRLFTPVYQSDSFLLAWLRDQLAAPASRVPPAPRLLAALVSGAIGSPLKKLGLEPGDQSAERDLSR